MCMFYIWEGEDLLLTLRVQPRASKDKVIGPHGDALKVRITAPPVDGAANQHLIRFFAKLCGVSASAVSVQSGATGRNKRLRIKAPAALPPGVVPKI